MRLFNGDQFDTGPLKMTGTADELLIQHLADQGVRNDRHERPSAADWEKVLVHAVARTPATAAPPRPATPRAMPPRSTPP
ncbi:hypothetical protein, partial [Streptomyces sp. 8K308]|uniref:hypothetical protein n=1 Tax=Streptomyces sp. 8K308 TaxID=2530388 RepID=UPI001A9F98D2